MEDDHAVLDADWKSLDGGIFVRLHGHFVGPHPYPVRVEDRPSTRDVELPAVPRAAQDLALAPPAVLAGLAWQRHPFDRPQTQRRALVPAAVAQRVALPCTLKTPIERPSTSTIVRSPGGNSLTRPMIWRPHLSSQR